MLKRHRAAALSHISKTVARRLRTRADQIVTSLGLPDSRRTSTAAVVVNPYTERRVACVEAHHYDLFDASSLLRVAKPLRDRVIKAVHATGLPVMFAHDLYDLTYGWGDAIAYLPKCAKPSDKQLRNAWAKVTADLETEIDDGDSGPRECVYGIGYFEDFACTARALCSIRHQLAHSPAKPDRAATRHWNTVAKHLERIGPEVVAWNFRDHAEARDGRPFEEAFIVIVGPEQEGLVRDYFTSVNDGSGEIPSLWFDLNDEQSLLRATLYPKLTAAVAALLESGSRQ